MLDAEGNILYTVVEEPNMIFLILLSETCANNMTEPVCTSVVLYLSFSQGSNY